MTVQIETNAKRLGHSVQQLPSGAGHDAQAFAPNCATRLIFVPSVGGISCHVAEFTRPEDIEAGGNVLVQTLLELAQ